MDLRSLKAFGHKHELLDAPLTLDIVLTLPDEVDAEAYPILARVLWKLFDNEMNSNSKTSARRVSPARMKSTRISTSCARQKRYVPGSRPSAKEPS